MPYSPINQGLQHPGERVRFSHPLLTEESETLIFKASDFFYLDYSVVVKYVVQQESFRFQSSRHP